MIVITEKDFTQLDMISPVKYPDKTPDIVVYSSIYNNDIMSKLLNLLNKIEYVKDKAFFSDYPSIKMIDELTTYPLPKFLEHMKSNVEKVVSVSLNSCMIQRGKWNNVINKQKITPSIIIGSDIELVIKKISSKKVSTDVHKDTVYNTLLKNGSLFVKRDTVDNYWSIKSSRKEELNKIFFVITFLDIFVEPTDMFLDCKKVEGYLSTSLPEIYLSTKQRVLLKEKIYNGLEDVHINPDLPEGKRCLIKNGTNHLKKYINLIEHIGSGDWGNVYSACLEKDFLQKRKFAIKMSRITENDFDDPYTESSIAWYEIWMLKDIIRPMIENSICPNLPLYMDTFLCNKCDLTYRGDVQQHPCIITVVELASGDLKKYFSNTNIKADHLYSVLFQVMAGLHAIHMRGQIFTNDIKAANILYYVVKPGGHWHYIVNGIDFYVPNYGYLFIINDFGVSAIYNPNFQLYPNKTKSIFNLGSRYAINMNDKFSPIKAGLEMVNNSLEKTSLIKWIDGDKVSYSNGAMYSMDRKTGQIIKSETELTTEQKKYLFSKGITTNPKTWAFFEYPDIIPPFEFYNDVQDVLRMFVGGKRSSQKGSHKEYPNVKNLVRESITPYLGKARGSKKNKNFDSSDLFKVFSLETYHVLAGSFITKFFTETVDYTKKLENEISTFNMKFY